MALLVRHALAEVCTVAVLLVTICCYKQASIIVIWQTGLPLFRFNICFMDLLTFVAAVHIFTLCIRLIVLTTAQHSASSFSVSAGQVSLPVLRTCSSLRFSELSAVAHEHFSTLFSWWYVVITILLLPHCGEVLLIVSNDVVGPPHLAVNCRE